MAAPWEKYQATPAVPTQGPWAKYAASAPPESPGLLSQLGSAALSGASDLGQYIDKYTGGPVRAGISAAQEGENPISAYAKQFGEYGAPTGKEIAAKAGLSETPIPPHRIGSMPYQAKPGEGVSPAGMGGLAIDVLADPTLAVQGGLKLAPRAAEALSPIAKGAKGLLQKGLGAATELTSGVPSEDAIRLMQNPSGVLNPKSALDIAGNARNELLARSAQEGKDISSARKTFADKFGDKYVDTTPVIENLQNKIAEKGLVNGEEGALSKGEQGKLSDFNSRLTTQIPDQVIAQKPAGSLQRFADYVGNQVKDFEQSKAPGSGDTVYQSQLRQTYGKVKELLHNLDPEGLGEADKKFHKFATDANRLGRLEDPNMMESFINNFQGKNKSLMRESAKGLIPENMSDIEDLGAAKGFNVIGPSGSHAGLRNMMSAGAMAHGAYAHDPLQMIGGALMQPAVQKQLLGRGSQLGSAIVNHPEITPIARGLSIPHRPDVKSHQTLGK